MPKTERGATMTGSDRDEHHDPRVNSMVIESVGNVIRKISIVRENGEHWTCGRDPRAAIYQREDGLWMVGWQDGAAGPFESSQFAQAVAQAMRGEAAA
jgi:hypothetical protein